VHDEAHVAPTATVQVSIRARATLRAVCKGWLDDEVLGGVGLIAPSSHEGPCQRQPHASCKPAASQRQASGKASGKTSLAYNACT